MSPSLFKVLLFLSLATLAQAQINIAGLSDDTLYVDEVTFTIENQAGYTYDARLDGSSVPVGSAVLVAAADYHELSVVRTNDTTQAVSSQVVQFVIRESARDSTEVGIPPHTPYPLVHSTSAEFAGARLRIIAPQHYPEGMDIPVVAWVENDAGHAVRVNGTVAAAGQNAFELFRGVGSGFLSATNGVGAVDYAPSVGGLTTNKTLHIEGGTVWMGIGGTLSGSINWPNGSRIAITNHVVLENGATLTIGAGTIVRISPGVDITNNAQVVINGTVEQPVVFAPVSHNQPWGGFTMRNSAGSIVGTGVIFTGSGAVPDWFGSGGNPGSHRREQALFFCGGDNLITLTDSAAVHLAGQLGHSVNGGNLTFTRFLLQRASTGGEFTGADFVVNDSAFIEFPEDSVSFTDGDNDALYIIQGTHGFTNTLFGWTKDDGVDSGGSGGGLLEFQNCWFEGIFHEGNSLSGVGKVVNHHHDVFLNCGQALEAGYDNPQGLLEDCLVIHNLTGGRFGDNYMDGRGYTGFLRATNSILIHNHRDVWGMNLNDWIYHTERMNVRSNWLTAPDPLWPGNRVWDPATDGVRLAAFLNTPPQAKVGIGLALRTTRFELGDLAAGVPICLSSFTTNIVGVDYIIHTSGSTLAGGTIEFQPGEMVRIIPPPASLSGSESIVRVQLLNPVGSELTGVSEAWFMKAPAALVSAGATWRYLDTGTNAGTAWRLPQHDDSALPWQGGPAELGYGEGDEATVISYGPDSNNKYVTTYFRHSFNVGNPGGIGGLTLRLKRDDGAIVYLNGGEVFRSSITSGPVDYLTHAIEASDDGNNWHSTNVPPSVLQPGTNVLAVEVHQSASTSSDVSFDLELVGVPLPVIEHTWFGSDWVLYWQDEAFVLETADLPAGPWTTVNTAGPVTVDVNAAQQFFRLKQP